jgi:hypothetical protein
VALGEPFLSVRGDRDICMTSESDLAPVLHIERELRHLAVELTQPKPGECLHCYVYRMLEFGCTGLRWAKRYRDLNAPRASALERRMMSKGAGCDCEIFMNGWTLRREYQVYDAEAEDTSTPKGCPRAKRSAAGRCRRAVCGPYVAMGTGLSLAADFPKSLDDQGMPDFERSPRFDVD